MKMSVLASVVVAALGSTAALAQSQPSTLPDASGPSLSAPAGAMDDGSSTAGSSLDRSSQSYDSGNSGRGAAGRPYGSGTSDGMSGDTAAGMPGSTQDSSTPMGSSQGGAMSQDSSSPATGTGDASVSGMGTTSTYSPSDSSALGAAGRSYDGSTKSGPASRSEVTADRDRAMHSDRWIFNDLDGLRRLDPGENSHVGRVYKGSADSY